MNALNFLCRICADELYFFTLILFMDSKLQKGYFKISFLFFQIVILFYQISLLRIFPFATIFLVTIPTIFIKFIWKYQLKRSLWISLQFTTIHYIISLLVEIIIFFVDFYRMTLPVFYEEGIYHNMAYYSLKDIFSSCVASIFLILWLSRSRLKQLNQKSRYEPLTYVILGVIITAIFILTYMFLYESDNITSEDIISISIIFIVSILLAMLWIVNKIVLTLQNQLLLEQQLRKWELERNYYDAISDSLSRLAKLRHDFKNYLIILQQYLLDGNHSAASSFISEISGKTASPLQIIITGNQTISAILNTKQDDCNKYEITFDVHIDFDKIFTLSDLDLVVLFGNLLDNAITASKQLSPENRFIYLSITQIDSHLSIICRNHFNGEIKEKHGILLSTKKDTENSHHGVGMTNMNDVILQNNGTLNYHYTTSIFTVEIMIPNYE